MPTAVRGIGGARLDNGRVASARETGWGPGDGLPRSSRAGALDQRAAGNRRGE